MFYDEAYERPGTPRAQYRRLLSALDGRDLDALGRDVTRAAEERGITFGEEPDGAFLVDPVPRVITAGEWRELEAGLVQRVRALERVRRRRLRRAADRRGRRRARARDRLGRLPTSRRCAGLEPPGGAASASPASTSCATRRAVPGPRGQPAHAVGDRLRRRGARARRPRRRPDRAPSAAPLDGALDAARRGAARGRARRPRRAARRRAHRRPGQLRLVGARAARRPSRTAARGARRPRGRATAGSARARRPPRPVDVVYRRTDEDRLRDDDGRPTDVGRAARASRCARGRLGLVNAFGTGVADDKLAHAYVEDMIRFYLGEEPLLPLGADLRPRRRPTRSRRARRGSTSSWSSRATGTAAPAWSIGPHAGRGPGARRGEAVRRRPAAGSPRSSSCSRRTRRVVDGAARAAPRRPAPLRLPGRRPRQALPGGLTRVALDEGALVVNSSQNGGAKDTWVLR